MEHTPSFEDMESDSTPLFTIYISTSFFFCLLFSRPPSLIAFLLLPFLCFFVFLPSNPLSTFVSLCVCLLFTPFFFPVVFWQQLNQLLKDATAAHTHIRINSQKTIKKNKWTVRIPCTSLLSWCAFSSVSLRDSENSVHFLLRTVTLKFHTERQCSNSPVSL